MCTDCKTISAKFFNSVCRVRKAAQEPAATPEPFVPVLSGERVLLSYPHAKKKQRFLELLCSETRFRQFPVEKTPTNSPEQKPKKQNKNSPKAKSKNKTLTQ